MNKPLVALTPLIKIALPAAAAAAVGMAMIGGGTQSRTSSRSSRNTKPVVASAAPVAAPPSHDPLFAFSSLPPQLAAGASAKRLEGKATVAQLWAGAHPRRGHTSGALLDRLNTEAGLLGKPGAATYTCNMGAHSCQSGPNVNSTCNCNSGCSQSCNPGGGNVAPSLGGTFTTAGTVNDNATTTPFASVTYSDSDGTAYKVFITYTAANGSLSGTGLTGSAGSYTVTGTSAADVQSKLRALVFTPTANQVAVGSTVVTTFTLKPNDGTVDGTSNATTQVTATSVNNSPAFVTGTTATFTVAGNSSDTDISGYLPITDADTGQTETWTVSVATDHSGIVTAGTTASSGSGSRTPSGWYYRPATGFSGTETFTIQVSDGTATATRAFSVTVTAISPTITSATYNASTNVLAVTGANMTTGDSIDTTKLTVTGEGGSTYTLAGTYTVTASSATSFSVTLDDTDARNVEGLLNYDGTVSVTSTTYNLAGAASWDASRATSADLTGNGVTVSNTQNPAITSATYDGTTGVLTVTGSNMVVKPGVTNDIAVSMLTLKGEGNATYTLTTSNVELTSSTAFSVTLNATDKAAVNQFLNKAGTTSTGGTTYNLAAALGWNTNINDGNLQDLTNPVTVSNVPVPTITSATYNASTGALVVTGTDLLKLTGATNDIVANKFTLTGEGGTTYTLTDTANVEITSGTAFTLTLSATDKAAVNQIINKSGTSSTGGTTYNLAAAEDWTAGAAAGVTDVDLTGNGITASNIAVPTITSATYDASTGSLLVTGTGFLSKSGSNNDIIANKLTITGEGGATYTLTDTANVDITSGTSFTLTLSATDKAAVNLIANKNGTSATSGTTFNLAAAEDWTAGAAAGVTDADLTSNGITTSNVAVPAITSVTYNYSTNVLTVTGTGFLSKTGATNDIDLTKLTFTGEGGATYTLTNSTGVEITSGTSFSVTLSGADLTNVEALLNKDGTASVSGTTYNLSAAASWDAGDASNGSDASSPITVSSYAAPTVTSATFDASTNVLTVTGTDLVSKSGAGNDVTVSLLTLTGEGGSYALTSSNVEVTNDTTFAVTLNAADQLVVRGLLNKNGTTSSGGTTYNLAAAEDWMAGSAASTVVADLTGNGITVSNFPTPTITSAVYDSDSGVLVVTGTNLFNKIGVTNDIVINKLTFTGGTANATYTLTSASNVEITSATSFTVTLTGADKTNVDALLDNIGTTSSGGSTYNLAAADGWLAGADSAVNIADAVNAVTVSISPKITSATYDAATGTLVVTGSNMQAKAGATNDITANKLTFTGEGGATYTLTDTANVELTSATSFTLTLSATDKAAINRIINKNSTVSTGATTYNIAVADDWDAQVTAGDTSDSVSNGVTASNVPVPTITSATYDGSTGALVVTGTGFLSLNGAANDIVANKFTVSGEGGATYTLTDTANVDITSGTAFTLTLSATDKAALNQIVNKNGTASTSATTYNLAAAEDWAAGADAAVVVADLTGNGITASNVAVPAISSATFDVNTGVLVVTGTGFSKLTGATNDIIANKFTFTGQGAGTYTLTDTANVEITSGTSFTLTLSTTDKDAVAQLLNKNGTSSVGGTTYNLAAAEDWAAGADAAVVVADLVGNGVTVSNAWVKSLAYSITTLAEAAANDGSITATSTITLTHETFTGANGDPLGAVSNVPAGLTASLVKASATTATLSFTGNATSHANANDIANLTVTFANADFTGGAAADVTGATTSNLVIDFSDPAAPTPSGGTSTTIVTLPTGGGTTTATAGQTLVVTDNGKSGTTIDLPSPPPTSNGSNNGVTVTLPGTGSVAVNSNSSGTRISVQQLVLPGSGGTVSTLAVSNGSATLVASGTGQTLVTTGLSNGLTVTSGGSGTIATVTASGNSQSLVLTGNANLTLGSSLDTQRTTLSLNQGSNGSASQANLNIGGQTLSVSSSGGNTQLQVVPSSTVNGQNTSAIVVTGGSANIIGQSGQVMNVIPSSTTCGSASGGYFEARSNNAQSNILSVNQGSLALTGHIPQGVVAYHYTSSSCNSFTMNTPLEGGIAKDVLIYQGEYVEVDKNGQPVRIVVRSKDGNSGAAGDPLTPTAIANLSVDTVIPRLDLTTGRLPTGQSIVQSISNMLKLGSSGWVFSSQDGQGAIRVSNSNSGDKVALLPVGQVLADAERQDGVQCVGNGLCQTSAGNLITSFNAALDAPQDFIAALRKIDSSASMRLNVDGNVQVTVFGRTYLVQAGWSVLPASSGNGFASSDGGLWFTAASGKQALYPVLAKLDRLLTVLKKIDPSATAQGDHQGALTAVVSGQSYRLLPEWELIATPASHASDDYWLDNGVLYLNFLDGTAQGIRTK